VSERAWKPGPWRFIDSVSPDGQEWFGCGVAPQVGYEFVWMENDPDRDIPTCHLIAAAPELYEVLSDFVAMGDLYCWHKGLTGRQVLMQQARAALAKAEGKQND